MSVYSGFATRQQQKKYNQLVEATMSILSKRLLKFYAGESCDQYKFKSLILNVHDRMYHLEQAKYMAPHYSQILREFLTEMQGVFSQFSRLKEEDPFSQTFLNLKKPQEKIRVNTIEKFNDEFEQEMDQMDNRKESEKTLNGMGGTVTHFKRKMKTMTPEKAERGHYYTPQQRESSLENSSDFKSKLMEKSPVIKTEEKKTIKREIVQIPRLENLQRDRQKQNLSPRQFLRQTIMGKDTKDSHLILRTKQKHQKITKF